MTSFLHSSAAPTPLASRWTVRGLRALGIGLAMVATLTADGQKPEEKGDGLTAAERDRIHDVLSKAWTDPEVTKAREEVHLATENYRKALRDAVARIDPEAVPVVAKLHEKSRVEAMRHKMPKDAMVPPWMGQPLPKEPAAVVRAIAGIEVQMRGLEGPDRDRFVKLAGQLGEAGTLAPAIAGALPALDEGGREAFKARRELRETFILEMGKLDPWAKKLLETDPAPMRPRDRDGTLGPPPGERGKRPE